jgi:hypothetical protein
MFEILQEGTPWLKLLIKKGQNLEPEKKNTNKNGIKLKQSNL